MRTSPTTLAGTISAAAFAVALVPGLPHSVSLVAQVVGAAGIAALGKAAKDCPANCPGTDSAGRPRQAPLAEAPLMPGLSQLPAVCALLAVSLLTGCALYHVSTDSPCGQGTNAPVAHTSLTGWTLLDSGQTIARASAHSGYATNHETAPGITMAGISQTSSSTGLVVIVQNVLPAVAPLVAATPEPSTNTASKKGLTP